MNRKTSGRTHKCCVGCHIFQSFIYIVWCSIECLYIWVISICININIYEIHCNLGKKKSTTDKLRVRISTFFVNPNSAICCCQNHNCLPVNCCLCYLLTKLSWRWSMARHTQLQSGSSPQSLDILMKKVQFSPAFFWVCFFFIHPVFPSYIWKSFCEFAQLHRFWHIMFDNLKMFWEATNHGGF